MERNFKIWRGNKEQGEFINYAVKLEQGMVVLDAIHRIQVEHANDLAVRWNCKAGKCGSCSVEINGRPKLACMTRINEYSPDEVVTVQPMKTFPIIKDLVTDVSWNYIQNKMILRKLKKDTMVYKNNLVKLVFTDYILSNNIYLPEKILFLNNTVSEEKKTHVVNLKYKSVIHR